MALLSGHFSHRLLHLATLSGSFDMPQIAPRAPRTSYRFEVEPIANRVDLGGATGATAPTSLRIDAGVRRRKLVPVGAMCLACVATGNGCSASHQIDLRRNWLEMPRIDARRVLAKVIEVKVLWNWPDEELVGEPVRGPVLATEVNLPVTAAGLAARPRPAATSAVARAATNQDPGEDLSLAIIDGRSVAGVHKAHPTSPR